MASKLDGTKLDNVEDVLLCFSYEPKRDSETLDRYIKDYPQFAEAMLLSIAKHHTCLSLDFSQYQPLAFATAIYPREHAITYPALGLASEAGEVAGKIKKMLRDGNLDIAALKAELGDVLWYIAALCSDLGLSMQEVAEENLRKLQDRKERDKLKGDGDVR